MLVIFHKMCIFATR